VKAQLIHSGIFMPVTWHSSNKWGCIWHISNGSQHISQMKKQAVIKWSSMHLS